MNITLDEILELDVKARLELIEEIWESISANSEAVPLTASQREELDCRKSEHMRDPSGARPWSEVHTRLESRTK